MVLKFLFALKTQILVWPMSWFPRLYGDLRLLGVAAWSIAVARAMLIARSMQEIKSFTQSYHEIHSYQSR